MSIYCVYLTTYKGSKLPPFYIGSSSVEKVNNGYHGSVCSREYKSIWKQELIENPQLFETKIISTHDDRKEATLREREFQKKVNAVKSPLYINQATGAGTFHADIRGKKNPFYGSSRTGEQNPMYSKTHKESTRKKMSASGKGKHSQPKTEEFKQTLREHYAGKTYEERFGIEYAAEIRAKQSGKIRTEEHKQKLSEAAKNRPRITCPHCTKSAAPQNFKKWHGDNCSSNPLRTIEDRDTIFIKNNPSKMKKQCPHCGTMAGGSLFTRWHGDNCKLFKIVSDPR